MTPKQENSNVPGLSQAEFQELVAEKRRAAIRLTLVTVLEEEVSALIGAQRYERTATRRDQRNGRYPRDLVTGMGIIEDLPVPRTRTGFRTQLFERYARRQAELDAAIGEMFVAGASTSQVGEVLETLTGSKPSPSTVSRVFDTLQAEFDAWKKRALAAHYRSVFADGTSFTVIYEDEGHKTPILAVVGINTLGERELLAFTIGERENQGAWEGLLDDLKARGVQTVDLWITAGHHAMLNAVALKFPESRRQRCVKHKLANVLSSVPQSKRDPLEPELKTIFYQDSRQQAEQTLTAFIEKYAKTYPTAIECLKRDQDACLTFYDFPKAHWKTIRTTNVIERLFLDVKKRVVSLNSVYEHPTGYGQPLAVRERRGSQAGRGS
ncbi:MAG: IS256 family transposase [Ardenticatenaceae bacterium]|nr:IS256 family transposase [Ardenticatenaceae bacterium]HBY99234.1 IS256 family transposase [Chloroflexota bacterium]